MNGKKIHKDFIDKKPPIAIPSSNEAWESMRKRLDEEQRIPFKWKWYSSAAIFLITGACWWLLHADYFAGRHKTSDGITRPKNGRTEIYHEKDRISRNITGIQRKEKEINAAAYRRSVNNSNVYKQSTVDYTLKKNSIRLFTADGNINNKSGRVKRIKEYFTNEGIAKGDVDFRIHKYPIDTITAGNGPKTPQDDTTNEKEAATERIIQAGLGWSVQLPINKANRYFAGPNGQSQPYRLVLPGIWISLRSDKHLMTVQVNPFATSVLANKPYATKSMTNGANNIIEIRTLHKIFGATADFNLDYNIKGGWWIGGHMQGNFWRSGTATVKGEKVDAVSRNTLVVYESNYPFNDSSWTGFTKLQIGTGVQLLYKLPALDAGLHFDFNVAPLIAKDGQKNKTAVQFFVRYPVYSSRRK